ncbi:ISAs1 family transposase [Cyanobium sp. CH-040]|uniref:ISAs1 family transposase n=1 Tax=Cyanobium sp. CH-040 TaxID=2823708 RepID=UPI0020CC8392|nr:ISAs1 family transposase [Cyanobium sp. CH-040]MCP9928368.1 ISAs1 family transposase [Cyanobium sp. CH-040]
MTVKGNQRTLHPQIRSQFQGKRKIPFTATNHQKRHGRDTTWIRRAREATVHIKENWSGCSWIVEVVTTVISKGKRTERLHYFLTSLRTVPKALLRLVRQRWSIENEWRWFRDVHLGEDAHRVAHRVGAPLFAPLRTVVMNLLRRQHHRQPAARARPHHPAQLPIPIQQLAIQEQQRRQRWISPAGRLGVVIDGAAAQVQDSPLPLVSGVPNPGAATP